MIQYTESADSLDEGTKALVKAFVSFTEEIEAANYYLQRLNSCNNPELKELMLHNMLEEVEHANKLMGWINKNNEIDIEYKPKFSADETAKEISDLVSEKNNDSAEEAPADPVISSKIENKAVKPILESEISDSLKKQYEKTHNAEEEVK
jgi:hypothetical protein